MERWKALNRYQQGILLLLLVLAIGFCVAYSVVTSKVGFRYRDTILLPSESGGSTVYSGKLEKQECSFTVTAKKEITFRLDDKVYGPYTVREDPTAKPKDQPCKMGIEVKNGDTIIFRGGYYEMGDSYMLIREDGTNATLDIGIVVGGQLITDQNNNMRDKNEPSVSAILQLVNGPELTNKGYWPAWFLCVFLSIWNAVCILFADELFRWYLRRRISDWQFAEPSEWEITSRYIGMTLMVALILFLYIKGLQ